MGESNHTPKPRFRPTDVARQQSYWLSALSDPMRMAIVLALSRGHATTAALVAELGTTATNLRYHLRLLEDVGAIRSAPDGTALRYALVGGGATGGGFELTHASGLKVTFPL